jgi:hypothetical protein
MRRLLPVLSVLACLALAACGWTGTGTVVGKSDYPAHYDPIFYCAAYGSKGMCMVYAVNNIYEPESWGITVQDSAGHNHDLSVSQADYDRLHAGDVYSNEVKK